MLTVENIYKSYGSKEVLRGVSFAVRRGTLNAIVGENGAGKSTLLKIIVGEIKADRGAVTITARTGYCPQEPLVFPVLTIEENFYYFASAYGLTGRGRDGEWVDRRDRLMSRFGFSELLHQRVDRLSGGTRQKLNLAISLLHHPEVLVLDEPYGGFDYETYEHFYEVMVDLKAGNRAILMVTHMVDKLALFDHVLALKDVRLT